MAVRCLSFHAEYRCHRTGACCTSSWPIPVEADRLARMRAALATGALRPLAGAGSCFETPPGAPLETPALLKIVDHRCVFFDEANGRACRVHAALGHDSLPLACRQFPRLVVRDPRGVSIVLSHYCPTAAASLGRQAKVTVVESPRAFPTNAEYEGLDAREALPPLLCPDVLMDWDSWWMFEHLSVELLGNSEEPVTWSLARLARTVERIQTWRPGGEALGDWIRQAFGDQTHVDCWAPIGLESRREEVTAAIPEGLRSRGALDGCGPPDVQTMRHVLAAHAFANWTAHLGRGLRSWLRSIEAAYALLQSGYGVRHTDLLLRHLADPRALAERWSAAEVDGGVRRAARSRRAGLAIRS